MEPILSSLRPKQPLDKPFLLPPCICARWGARAAGGSTPPGTWCPRTESRSSRSRSSLRLAPPPGSLVALLLTAARSWGSATSPGGVRGTFQRKDEQVKARAAAARGDSAGQLMVRRGVLRTPVTGVLQLGPASTCLGAAVVRSLGEPFALLSFVPCGADHSVVGAAHLDAIPSPGFEGPPAVVPPRISREGG